MLRIVWHQSSIHTWKNSTTNFTLFVYFMITSWLHHDYIMIASRIIDVSHYFSISSVPTHWAPVISVDFAHREILNQSIRKFHLKTMKIQNDSFAFKACCSNMFKPFACKILGFRTFGVIPSLARECRCWLRPHWFVCSIVSWGSGPKLAMAKFVGWMLQLHVYQNAFAIKCFGTQTMDIKENMGSIVLKFVFD